jgi:hypothetical protein
MKYMKHMLFVSLLLALVAGCNKLKKSEPNQDEQKTLTASENLINSTGSKMLGFELPDAWTTAPLTELLSIDPKSFSSNCYHIDPQVLKPALTDLANGARLVASPFPGGSKALRWDQHPKYPTLRSTVIPTDWSGAKAMAIDINSEVATGELICVAFKADSPKTPNFDWWYWPPGLSHQNEM